MASRPVPDAVAVSPGSLAAICAAVPDPRRTASGVYPPPAILALVGAVLPANHRSRSFVEFGESLGAGHRAAWGAGVRTRRRPPRDERTQNRDPAASAESHTVPLARARRGQAHPALRRRRLPPETADPVWLLALRRGHWGIENRLHRRQDVAFGEDASLVHAGAGSTVMALLRDAAVRLLHRAGIARVAACLRAHNQQPEQAVALVVGPLPTGA